MKNKYIFSIFFTLLFGTTSYAQCLDDTHTPFAKDSWVSCEVSANPNPERPSSHWIMYDFGYEYVLDSTHIWNLNTWSRKEAGIQEAVIDYSLDGVEWITLDTFVIEEAPASYKYQGVAGPSFDQTTARYVLITALSNWGDPDCVGLSEIRFSLGTPVSTEPELEIADALIRVLPNPVQDIANISIVSERLPERVGLYDLSGRLVQEQNTILSKNVQFNMKGLAGGIYFVKAWIGETVLTEKVVKVGK